MQVVRSLSNNAVLAQTGDGAKCVLVGKGIGWNKRLGDAVDMAAVTHRFVPDGRHTLPQLAAFISDIPLDIVLVAQKVVAALTARTAITGSQGLLLTVADHIHTARLRLETDEGDHPLGWEVAQLYPDEFAAGREAVAIVERELGWSLPNGEAVAFALHLINAAAGGGNMAKTADMTRRIRQILDVVQAVLGRSLADDSMNVARFVTHLRYLFVRIEGGQQIQDGMAVTLAPAVAGIAGAQRAAERASGLFEMDGAHLTRDEVSYLALHIARLEQSAVAGQTDRGE